MADTLKHLRAVADPTRLRLLALLAEDELSVAELCDITQLAQSRISTHLGQLAEAGLVEARRDGKRTFYRWHAAAEADTRALLTLALAGAAQQPEAASDSVNLRRARALRADQAKVLFYEVAGRFGRSYGPGRTWHAFGQLLLRMLPAVDVADLGAGEGLLSELLALRCRRVIAVDNSEKIIAFGAEKARRAGLANLEFRLGDLQAPPLPAASVDVVILSQALHHAEDPPQALHAAAGLLRPRGQVLILDLLEHDFAEARGLYGDRWLGFAESDLHRWLEAAGLRQVEVTRVAREEKPPYFETLLAAGEK
ncbi:MAG: metalloregulator ArsR/SmtB family transcription factor [Limisphaerales bacterium]